MDTNEVVGQQQLFYTEEELQAKISQVVENLTEAHAREIRYASNKMRVTAQDNAIDACRGMLGEVDEESMLSIYNTIADAVGWDTITAFTKTFIVTVSYQGDEIGQFEVEAEDEDSAIEDVRDNLSIDASMDITLNYNGNSSGASTVVVDAWDLTDDLEFEVEEA